MPREPSRLLRLESSALGSDNHPRAVYRFRVSVQRRGETASGKPCQGSRLALQVGIGSNLRDAEVPKSRLVAELQPEGRVNEQATDRCYKMKMALAGHSGAAAGNRLEKVRNLSCRSLAGNRSGSQPLTDHAARGFGTSGLGSDNPVEPLNETAAR